MQLIIKLCSTPLLLGEIYKNYERLPGINSIGEYVYLCMYIYACIPMYQVIYMFQSDKPGKCEG